MNKLFVGLGIVLLVIGLCWSWMKGIPFGRLPGDLTFSRGNFRFYLPLGTSLLVSIILSLLLWFFRK